MKRHTFVQRSRLDVSAEVAFRWHARSGALERLTPPWEPVHVVERSGDGIRTGARVVLRMRAGPVALRWVAQHRDYEEGRLFRDVMIEGPFPLWDHRHSFEPDGADACFLEDRIEYALPLGGDAVASRFVRRKLERLFTYRHRITAQDLSAHARYAQAGARRVVLTGATGLVGSAIGPFLATGGHEVVPLRFRGAAEPAAFQGADAVVHLAGAGVADARWTAARKRSIRESRVAGTRALVAAILGAEPRPRVLVCASAVGFYGDRGDEELPESAGPGAGFLADVVRGWEDATRDAERAGLRVVRLRIGVVLAANGGALAKMLLPFRLGLGGPLGSGRQWMSWISLEDLVEVIHCAVLDESFSGSVNAVAPSPVRQVDFARTLGRVLRRPAIAPMPALAVRAAFGELADEALLASQRCVPAHLHAAGHAFRHPALEGALRAALGRSV